MKLTVIGGGPGGYETALEAASKGMEVVLVSAGPLGGTCLNEGCIPTKTLRHSAEMLDSVESASAFGLSLNPGGFDLKRAVERKNEVLETLRSGVESLLARARIPVLYGRASFIGPHSVRVALKDGGSEDIESDYIIVACGSVSASLHIPGAENEGIVDSSGMLSLSEVPARLCIIGAGVIGLEFASIFRSFGSEVTVVEYCPEVLPRFDTELSRRLRQSLVKKGINIVTSAAVERIEKDGNGLKVCWKHREAEESFVADKVLMAVGRAPAVEAMNFGEAKIEFDRKGVKVNRYMQTSVPWIYAIGDITGGYMLAHAAVFQGKRALNHILSRQVPDGEVDDIRLDLVPAAVFTLPEAASVGLSGDYCKESGIPFRVMKSAFRANGKAVSMGETDGLCKLVVRDGESGSYPDGEILGCHIVGPHASDIIHEAAALIAKGATVEDLRNTIHAHPTLPEVLLAAASQ